MRCESEQLRCMIESVCMWSLGGTLGLDIEIPEEEQGGRHRWEKQTESGRADEGRGTAGVALLVGRLRVCQG